MKDRTFEPRLSRASWRLILLGVLILSMVSVLVPRVASVQAGSIYASDGFNRTVSNGWGTADTGGPWSIVGTSSNWSVSPGAGSISVSAGGQEIGYMGSVSTQDVEILTKVVVPKSTQSNNCLLYVLGRYTAGSNPAYYRVGVEGSRTGALEPRRPVLRAGSFSSQGEARAPAPNWRPGGTGRGR